ncbi:MAG: tetratricopeptide repeat protein [Gammaproteobacteria bacterium]|nr:tetratricopeptide repeat protein [Gammaproteobacteria bacterium]
MARGAIIGPVQFQVCCSHNRLESNLQSLFMDLNDLGQRMKLKTYIAEFKRRNVFKSGLAYLVISWLIAQVASIVFPAFDAPDYFMKTLLFVLAIGFPTFLLFAWVYELTPDGIRKTDSLEDQSTVTPQSSDRLNKLIIGALLAVATLLLVDILKSPTTPVGTSTAVVGVSENESRSYRSIAVIPFHNRSDLKEDEFFTDGIHDDLLTQISKIRDIKTISRTSVMEYRNTTKNIRVIGEELGAATILEGGVQRAGNQIRINVQLIDAKTDQHLWAETFTRELTAKNIFSIQSEIVGAIATSLQAILSPQEKEAIQKLPTQNLKALEAWFQAKSSIGRYTNEGYQEAIVYLEDALQFDPDFVIAYATLGKLHIGQIYWEGLPRDRQIAKAEPLIKKAMILDNKNSEVYVAYGDLLAEVDRAGAKPAYQTAIDLNPNNASAYASLGSLYRLNLLETSRAIDLFYKARELDPKDDALGLKLADVLIMAGRFDESEKIVQDIIRRKPNYASAYAVLSSIQFYGDGNIAESQRTFYENVKLDPNVPGNSMLIGFTYAHMGDTEAAIQWLEHALLLAPESTIVLQVRAMLYELKGDYDGAVDAYLEIPRSRRSSYRLLDVGLKANRTNEVMAYFEENYPDLLEPDVQVNKNNFTQALALGRLLQSRGDSDDAERLLAKSLDVVVEGGLFGAWVGYQNNWETRIHMAMGNNEAALISFSLVVAGGYHPNHFLIDPIYEPLYADPEYQRIIGKVKADLEHERVRLKEMETNGVLPIPRLPVRTMQRGEEA